MTSTITPFPASRVVDSSHAGFRSPQPLAEQLSSLQQRIGSPTVRFIAAQPATQRVLARHHLTTDQLLAYEDESLEETACIAIDRKIDHDPELDRLSSLLHEARARDHAFVKACVVARTEPSQPAKAALGENARELFAFYRDRARFGSHVAKLQVESIAESVRSMLGQGRHPAA